MEPVYAVGSDGAPVRSNEFVSFFRLDERTGEISVAARGEGGGEGERGALDRAAAAVVTLTVAATDMVRKCFLFLFPKYTIFITLFCFRAPTPLSTATARRSSPSWTSTTTRRSSR